MSVLAPIAFAGLAAAVFGWFVWAIRWHFVSDRMPWLMKIVSWLAITTFGLGAWSVFSDRPEAFQLAAAASVVGVSALQFRSALRATRGRNLTLAFDPAAPAAIVETGPYRFVRHPFYLSYVIFWLGWLIAAPVWPVAAPVAGLITLYVLAARQEERAILQSALADPYRGYMARAGFLWPLAGRPARRSANPSSAADT